MKINEKNLAAFATSATPVDKEGWLMKKGEVNKSFQKRWFVLKGNLLFYFEKKGDKEPVGVIILEGCTIELAEEEEQFCFKIVFHGMANRVYVMGADSQEAMEGWMKALACASYDYLKLMVAELQRQLEELGEVEQHQQKQGVETADSNTKPRVISPPEAPVPPPRLRHNPFGRGGVTGSAEGAVTERSSVAALLTSKPRKTFQDLHLEMGARILRDREERAARDGSGADAISPIKEDVLIVL